MRQNCLVLSSWRCEHNCRQDMTVFVWSPIVFTPPTRQDKTVLSRPRRRCEQAISTHSRLDKIFITCNHMRSWIVRSDQSVDEYKYNSRRRKCDLTPSISGRSPGALTSESLIRLRTCVTERTVAATNHGSPSNEHTMMSSDKTNRSRWYPKPFCAFTLRSIHRGPNTTLRRCLTFLIILHVRRLLNFHFRSPQNCRGEINIEFDLAYGQHAR